MLDEIRLLNRSCGPDIVHADVAVRPLEAKMQLRYPSRISLTSRNSTK
jgi:hypothetical protein